MKKENKILEAWYNLLESIGEGTNWDLDYGKLVILAIVIYIAIQVS